MTILTFDRFRSAVAGQVATAQIRRRLSIAHGGGVQVGRCDTTNPSAALPMPRERRGKQERCYPSVTPDDARATYHWGVPPPNLLNEALGRLLGSRCGRQAQRSRG